MKKQFIYVLDYTNAEVIAIELSASDMERAKELEAEGCDFSGYVEGELFDRLRIKSDNCHWMSSDNGSITLTNTSKELNVILDIFK